jgi:ferredoxin-NADP reductase
MKMKAIISKKEMAAEMTCYAEFELGGESVNFTPGQYFFITLNPKDEMHKDELTHHFSIVNSPNQKGVLALATRLRLDQSFFKRTLNEAKVGDEVEIGKIAGTFVLAEDASKPVVLIALGIGITPYMSMLRWAFEENKPYQFTLIYSDNEVKSMAFLEELKQMDSQHDNLKMITSVTRDEGWQGEKRHVDGDFVKEYLGDGFADQLYYVSGPPAIVEKVAASLKQAGIAEDAIKTDSFSGY